MPKRGIPQPPRHRAIVLMGEVSHIISEATALQHLFNTSLGFYRMNSCALGSESRINVGAVQCVCLYHSFIHPFMRLV